MPAWRAVRVVAERRGRGRDDRLEAPFVGRDAELRLLKDLFHATSRERRVRLVSITGQARHRQEPARVGVPQVRRRRRRDRLVARGPLAVLRRGDHVLGAGRDGALPGAPARDRRSGHDAHADRRDARRSTSPTRTERRRIEPALLALLGVGEAPAGGAGGAVLRLADVLRAARGQRAWSRCCSRTSSGPTRGPSTSSSTCSSGAATSRS